MKALYVTGGALTQDLGAAEQLKSIAPDLTMTVVSTATDALDEVRRANGYQVLFTAPALPHDDTLALITSLRRDRAALAVIPVVGGDQPTFSASAMSAGADDVLVMTHDALVGASETMQRIRQSPYVQPADTRPRLRTLYAGKDPLVWHLLEQIPFIAPERAAISADGVCLLQVPGADVGRLRCDVVVIDEQPGDAHPLQVVKSVKSQAADLPILVLTSPQDHHTGTAALDLGADDAVSKTGVYRRRFISTLRRLHHRVEVDALHATVVAREARLRQIVERLPEGVAVISDDGRLLAANAAALAVLGTAQPSEVVGREFLTLVDLDDRADTAQALDEMRDGAERDVSLTLLSLDGSRPVVRLRGVLLERDARGRRGVVAMLDRRVQPTIPAAAIEAEGQRHAARAIEAEQRASALANELQAAKEQQRRLEAGLARAGLAQDELTARDRALAAERDAHADTRAEASRLRDTVARLERLVEDRADEARARAAEAVILRARVSDVRSNGHAQAMDARADQGLCSLVAMVTTTADGRVVRANEAFARLLGHTDYNELMRALDGRPLAGLQFIRDSDADLPNGVLARVRFPLVTRDGVEFHVTGTIRRLEATDGEEPVFERALLSVNRDAELQDALRTAARLGDVGQLSLSMVPELLTLVDAWRQQTSSPQAQQADEILGQLSAFGRYQASATSSVDLRLVLEQARALVAQLAGPQIRVALELNSAPVANVPRADLEQLVASMVVRGRDLLPAGGTLEIGTGVSPRGTVLDRGNVEPLASQQLRTTVHLTLRGYGLRPLSSSPALEDIVGRCGGVMHALAEGPRQSTFVIALPTPRQSLLKEQP